MYILARRVGEAFFKRNPPEDPSRTSKLMTRNSINAPDTGGSPGKAIFLNLEAFGNALSLLRLPLPMPAYPPLLRTTCTRPGKPSLLFHRQNHRNYHSLNPSLKIFIAQNLFHRLLSRGDRQHQVGLIFPVAENLV